LELMRTLGRGPAMHEALVAEALGMSTEELSYVARPPAELWRHFGFAEQTGQGGDQGRYIDALVRVPVFLDATGMTCQRLTELVSTRFVNADAALTLESPAPDCDPEKVRIAGL